MDRTGRDLERRRAVEARHVVHPADLAETARAVIPLGLQPPALDATGVGDGAAVILAGGDVDGVRDPLHVDRVARRDRAAVAELAVVVVAPALDAACREQRAGVAIARGDSGRARERRRTLRLRPCRCEEAGECPCTERREPPRALRSGQGEAPRSPPARKSRWRRGPPTRQRAMRVARPSRSPRSACPEGAPLRSRCSFGDSPSFAHS